MSVRISLPCFVLLSSSSALYNGLGRSSYDWNLDTPCEGSDDMCWKQEGAIKHKYRLDCCNTTRYGPYGKSTCFNPLLGFTYLRCCCYTDDGFSAHRYRFKMRVNIARKLATPGAIDNYSHENKSPFGSIPVSFNGPGLRGPAATVSTLLFGIQTPSAYFLMSALRLLFGPKEPIVTHLKCGWPVFALFKILVGLVRSELQLVAPESYTAGERLGSTTSTWQQNACLKGCVGATMGLSKCAEHCFDAVAMLPLYGDLDESRHEKLVGSLWDGLLKEGEGALQGLGVDGLSSLSVESVSSLFASLHRLQTKVYFHGPCTPPMIHFQVEAEPNYAVCLPMPEENEPRERILLQGRWKYCDALSVFLKRRPTVVAIDVGHNIGFCTGYLLALGVRVIAIDPSPAMGEAVRGAFSRELKTNQLTVWTLAVSNVVIPPVQSTLDSLATGVESEVLMKMDIDGAELEALLGAVNLLETRIVGLLLDVHTVMLEERGIRPWDIVELLFSFGLRVCLVVEIGAYPFKHVKTEADLTAAGRIASNVVLGAYKADREDVEFEMALGRTN